MSNAGLIAIRIADGESPTPEERGLLTPELLAILAVAGHIELARAELKRLPPNLRAIVEAGGHEPAGRQTISL
jgi:hypothetical protein